MIQPAVNASRNGTQRFTVSPLQSAFSCAWSVPARRLNHAGRAVRAGTGSATTPRSSGAHRKSTPRRRRRTGPSTAAASSLGSLERLDEEFELELLDVLLLEFELELELEFPADATWA